MNYDSFGNRTQSDFQTTACNPGSDPATARYSAANQITWFLNSAPSGFAYDASGDVTSDGINYYAYDGEGRLCATETWPYSGGVVAFGYVYDAEGRRVAKGTVNSAPYGSAPSCNPASNGFTLTESYVLGQVGERLTTLAWTGGAAGTSAWQSTNVYGGGKLIATYDSTLDPTTGSSPIVALHFQLTDPLGTRRVQTNAAGEAELDCQSLPFGDQLNCFADPNAPNDDQGQTPPEHRLASTSPAKKETQNQDSTTSGPGTSTSTMGRWMSPDWASKPEAVPYSSLDNPQSLNLYGYVLNNPLSHADADGHCCDPMDVLNFAAGAANAFGSDNLLGAGRVNQTTSAGQLGAAVGDLGAMVQGAAQVVLGTAGTSQEWPCDATGVGAAVASL